MEQFNLLAAGVVNMVAFSEAISRFKEMAHSETEDTILKKMLLEYRYTTGESHHDKVSSQEHVWKNKKKRGRSGEWSKCSWRRIGYMYIYAKCLGKVTNISGIVKVHIYLRNIFSNIWIEAVLAQTFVKDN